MANFNIRCFMVLLISIKTGEGHLTVANIGDEFLKLKNRVEQLEETTKKQSDQLYTLQETVTRLERTTQRQSGLITHLQRTNREYRNAIENTFKIRDIRVNKGYDRDDFYVKKLANCSRKFNSNEQSENMIRPTSKRSVMKFSGGNPISRKERLLAPLSTSPTTSETVAFYAYMVSPVPNIGPHHVLVFDVVKTNVGNGYHQHTGVFIAPKSGLYVFYWNIRVYNGQSHAVELVVNNEQVGFLREHTASGQDSQGGNLAVVYVNRGDDVFVRITATDHVGNLYSSGSGRPSFSGWLLL